MQQPPGGPGGDPEHPARGFRVHHERAVAAGQLVGQPGQGLQAARPAGFRGRGGRVPGRGNQRDPLPVQGEAAGARGRVGPGQRRLRVGFRVLGGPAHPDADLDRDAEFGTGPLAERGDPETVGRRGQRTPGGGDQEAVVADRADRGVHPLRLLDQEPVHGEPQFLARVPRRGPAGGVTQRGHLDQGHRELGFLQPPVARQQGGGAQRGRGSRCWSGAGCGPARRPRTAAAPPTAGR